MKAVVAQADLNQALKVLYRNFNKRPTHPILANVNLTAAADGYLTCTVFDLTTVKEVTIKVLASVAEPGSITAPVTILKDIVNGMPKGTAIDLMVDGDNLVVSSGKASVQVGTMPSDDFPEMFASEGNPKFSFSMASVDFASGVSNSVFAASDDFAKQLLTGVNLKLTGNALTFASTDGHRLSVVTMGDVVDSEESEFDMTLPSKILKEVAKVIGNKPKVATVSFVAYKGSIKIIYGLNEFQFRALDGNYPNYHQLTPDKFAYNAVLNRTNLLSTLEQAAIVAEHHNNVVKLNFSDSGVVISADAESVSSFHENMPVVSGNAEITIAFNVRYLIDALKTGAIANMANDNVVFKMNAPATPAVIAPEVSNPAIADYYCLVMPVQIRK